MFHYSPKKFSALKEMQALVNHPQLKMIKPSDTRWLAYDKSNLLHEATDRYTWAHPRRYWRARSTWYAEDYKDIQLCGDPDDAKWCPSCIDLS